ncbi:MAG: DUF374 domain-containing protein, partial [Nitrospinaceae bacterium]|nr:lysophospholipid acyltransferase family protein [Nitrospinaceae bacterium]NIR54224.1 lysophospholipid acyltransferase family protein [Nitrospinaceae bacterium]NIS84639.1 lysophospholipid acyltransferase family protein [Nitrospinaceae bacterium]NIT81434.1 lysophospholipid acyltransferase family protein [Nitrospinaceae bacterium]NIU43717.1 lysophospholipid acyltransferase family protein [Nitrospinaceae bacterium]
MKKFLYKYVLPPLLWVLIHLWCKTLRVTVLNPEMEEEIRTRPGKAVYTFWHSNQIFFFYHFRGLNRYTLLISPSADGDLLANLCGWFGYKVVRGSSFKKTYSGSRELVEILNEEGNVLVIADGSRGPRHQAQAGSIQLARITGAPIYSLFYDAHPKYEFNSWDRSVLPLPFSRVVMNIGPVITVP